LRRPPTRAARLAPSLAAPSRRSSNSSTLFPFNSYILIPLQLLMLQGFGHLERHNPLAPQRQPHNPLGQLLRAAARRWPARQPREACNSNGTPVDAVMQLAGQAVDAQQGAAAPAKGAAAVPGGAADGAAAQEPRRAAPAGPLELEDVLSVCRLPPLGRLFMLHLGPMAPPGQEAALSSGAFRLPFVSDQPADRCAASTRRLSRCRSPLPAAAWVPAH
jgi:hypothetical protein